MSAAAAAVAVGFGLMVGWGLGRFLDDRSPARLSLLAGVLAGGAMLATSFGADPTLAGGSLVLGCLAGLVTLHLRRPG